MSIVDKSSRTPLYVQLMNILIELIENNLEENEQLLSEREICEKYDVSRTTVRQTMDELEKEGYIYKIHGKGTFVAPKKKFNQDLISFYSFTEEMKKIGRKPSSEVIAFEEIEADSKIASKLNISNKDLLYKISRIRKADDVPMIYETTYLPLNKFKNLLKSDLIEKPMYEVLISKYDVKLTSAEEYFQPILTNKVQSEYLNITEGAPSLKIERFTYDNIEVIEYTISIARGDKFKYRVKLNNN